MDELVQKILAMLDETPRNKWGQALGDLLHRHALLERMADRVEVTSGKGAGGEVSFIPYGEGVRPDGQRYTVFRPVAGQSDEAIDEAGAKEVFRRWTRESERIVKRMQRRD